MEPGKKPPKLTIHNERIEIATNSSELRDKIRLDVFVGKPVSWYILFNIPLDKSTVSHKTMNVTETDGSLLDVDIHYEEDKNLIVIDPVSAYEDNSYYILNISTKVKSKKGNALKREIHVLFKLVGNKIAEHLVLPESVRVPKPHRNKNRSKAKAKQSVSKYYSFMQDRSFQGTGVGSPTLPIAPVGLRLWLLIVGLVTAIVSVWLNNLPMMLGALGLNLLIVIYICIRGFSRRSIIQYNLGAIWFNAGRYNFASKFFRRALRIDETNEFAEYALNKVSFFRK